MKKLILLLFAITATASAATVNQIVASVGKIAITSYDVQQLRDFDQKVTGKRPSANDALERLISMAALLSLSENNPDYYMDEIELRKTINSITNNPTDPTTEQRKKIYEEHSEIYRMAIRADKVKRGMMYLDLQVKQKLGDSIPAKESRDFYNKNKAAFKDSPFPKFDLIIFAVESDPKWSLSELADVETQMEEIAKCLDKSSDFNAIRRKFPKLRLTRYSGKTGLFGPDVLILQKRIPEEVLGISLEKSIQLGPVSIPIIKNKGIYIPSPIPLQSTGAPTYLTLKILRIDEPKQLTYEEALPQIEEILRMQKAEVAINDAIKERIKSGQITLNSLSKGYDSVFRKFK